MQLSDNHYDKVGVLKEVVLVEQLQRKTLFTEQFQQAIDLVRHFHVNEVEYLTEDLIDCSTLQPVHDLVQQDTTDTFILTHQFTQLPTVYLELITQQKLHDLLLTLLSEHQLKQVHGQLFLVIE